MKERPILFSGPMVRALLDGSKTQTRRVVRKQFGAEAVPAEMCAETAEGWQTTGHSGRWWDDVGGCDADAVSCPFGVPDDRLWVRETFFAYGRWETRFSAKKGRDEWHFIDMTLECDRAYQYAADNPDVPVVSSRHGGVTPAWWKRPGIFMPRAASRITLEVAGVRVERLQDIREDDAIAEGIGKTPSGFWSTYARSGVDGTYSPRSSFHCLWDSINGPESWDANPWVWVVEFKRLTQS